MNRDEIREAVVLTWEAPRPGRQSLSGGFADAFGTATEAMLLDAVVDTLAAFAEERPHAPRRAQS